MVQWFEERGNIEMEFRWLFTDISNGTTRPGAVQEKAPGMPYSTRLTRRQS